MRSAAQKLGDACARRGAARRATAKGVRRRAVEVDQRRAFAAREQQARLLEALADRGDVEVEAAVADAEAPARLRVVSPTQAECAARSPGSTRPPGKTQAPLLWSPRSARRDSRTSMPAGRSRSTTIVADGSRRPLLPTRSARGRVGQRRSSGGRGGTSAAGAVAQRPTGLPPAPEQRVGAVRHARARTPDRRSARLAYARAPPKESSKMGPLRHPSRHPRAPTGVQTCFTMPLCSS